LNLNQVILTWIQICDHKLSNYLLVLSFKKQDMCNNIRNIIENNFFLAKGCYLNEMLKYLLVRILFSCYSCFLIQIYLQIQYFKLKLRNNMHKFQGQYFYVVVNCKANFISLVIWLVRSIYHWVAAFAKLFISLKTEAIRNLELLWKIYLKSCFH
jgi:hypothetical protein